MTAGLVAGGQGGQRGQARGGTVRPRGRSAGRTRSPAAGGRAAAAALRWSGGGAASAPPAAGEASSPWVYGCAGDANSVNTSACSTTRPAYMTATRRHMLAMTPMSCVMRMTAVCRSRQSRLISFRTCACTVTSRAVVGSSAISSAGSQASAMAIMTRCRRPPLSSCGYCFARSSAAGISVARSIRSTSGRRRTRFIPLWKRKTSAIWNPTVFTGFNEVRGSWKIMEICAPRTLRSARASSSSRFRPMNSIRPPTILPGGDDTRPRMERAVTLLPQPDSPTSPRTSPRLTARSTPSTALIIPSRVWKCVRSPEMLRISASAGSWVIKPS